MRQYEKGSVIKFSNQSLGELLIIDQCNENNEQFLLVTPYKPSETTIDIEMNKLILIKIQEDENAVVVTDKQIVQNIVEKLLLKNK